MMTAQKLAEPPTARRERALADARERARDRVVEAYLRSLTSEGQRRPTRAEIHAILVDTERP